MPGPILETSQTDCLPAEFLGEVGRIHAIWDSATQDSGNVSYGVEVDGDRHFVKTAGEPDTDCYHSFEERVARLGNAVALHRAVSHPALARLRNVIESPLGPMLVYEWAEGELVRSGLERFRALPADEIVSALDAVYDLHGALAAAGWIAEDFYDGCLIYDFARRAIRVVDLDHYHRGPFVNAVGRLCGSSRFMAPEEFEKGARIDERTTVFNLGRAAAVLLSDGSLERTPFRGSGVHLEAARRACRELPGERFESVAGFLHAWRS